jgi:hypothetical protein
MSQRVSYWKTIALAGTVAAGSLVCLVVTLSAHLPVGFGVVAGLFWAIIFLVTALVVAGGAVCLWRDGRIESGEVDPIGVALNRVPSSGLLARLGLRSLLGSAPRPGDLVVVKSLAEIQATLDGESSLEGLPFMPEMQAYCGRTLRVHRRVDKIWDMRHKTGLRRLSRAVSLTEVRCDGAHHGGCQAGCQIIWKDAWLRRLSSGASGEALVASGPTAADRGAPESASQSPPDAYICQMTRLWEASRPMSRRDFRQDLRPLLSGSVAFRVYVLVLLTRLFGTVQAKRGGLAFPYMPEFPPGGAVGQDADDQLAEGQTVVVRDRAHIARTLVNSKTKGLWYDREMIRYCGNVCVVQQRVDHLIHEATGKMVRMKTNSWVLRGVTAPGEFHRLCFQHEYIHWREAWLQPATTRLELSKREGRRQHDH